MKENDREQSLIDQYKTEIISLHAPNNLILQTKNKMSMEEQRLIQKKKRKEIGHG